MSKTPNSKRNKNIKTYNLLEINDDLFFRKDFLFRYFNLSLCVCARVCCYSFFLLFLSHTKETT